MYADIFAFRRKIRCRLHTTTEKFHIIMSIFYSFAPQQEITARAARSACSSVVCFPNENRTPARASSSVLPMASITCDGRALCTEHAAPPEAAIPARSSLLSNAIPPFAIVRGLMLGARFSPSARTPLRRRQHRRVLDIRNADAPLSQQPNAPVVRFRSARGKKHLGGLYARRFGNALARGLYGVRSAPTVSVQGSCVPEVLF